MSLVRLVDTGECVHADWAAENAVQKGGVYYANDPDQSGSGAKDGSSAIATSDFVKGKEIARALRQPSKSKGISK